ncbi:glycosyltransferase family 9 protein [candidate division CSSED10-310 bacterium]|uniref:Glycosyltransferase family 9 protein n=1 Tax=candidate division CSSED10-310 bacterium TaxID=2855610 RepID=A0ABV6YUX6_UNCC1
MDDILDLSKKVAKADCRRFIGEKPCQPDMECADCPEYDPMGTRILIIKLAAGGDVLRTAALLPGLKKAHPRSHITWLTETGNTPLLLNNRFIDRVLTSNAVSFLTLTTEQFDILINLDKVQPALALAERVLAPQRFGFGMEKNGALRPLNQGAAYAFWLGLSDQLKFKENKKTYPLIIYEICGLEYQGEKYHLWLDEKQQSEVHRLRRTLKTSSRKFIIGLNTGSGPVFATKRWGAHRWIELAALLDQQMSVSIALLGGPEEIERNNQILHGSKVPLFDTGTDNSLTEFVAIIGAMDCVITSDTLAMHIALALGKKVIVLLGPTSASEIDIFGQGQKIVSDFECAPCYRKECDRVPLCMEAIKAETVATATRHVLVG